MEKGMMGRALAIFLMLSLCVGFLMAADKKKAPEGKTVITSTRLEYNYRAGVAVFEGNVVVKDPEMKMTADKLSISMDRTNSTVKMVTATGNVKMWYQDKTASGNIAIYQATKGEVELRGNASVARGEDVVQGDRIVFWIHEEKMIVEPGNVTVAPKTREDGSLQNVFQMDGSTNKKTNGN